MTQLRPWFSSLGSWIPYTPLPADNTFTVRQLTSLESLGPMLLTAMDVRDAGLKGLVDSIEDVAIFPEHILSTRLDEAIERSNNASIFVVQERRPIAAYYLWSAPGLRWEDSIHRRRHSITVNMDHESFQSESEPSQDIRARLTHVMTQQYVLAAQTLLLHNDGHATPWIAQLIGRTAYNVFSTDNPIFMACLQQMTGRPPAMIRELDPSALADLFGAYAAEKVKLWQHYLIEKFVCKIFNDCLPSIDREWLNNQHKIPFVNISKTHAGAEYFDEMQAKEDYFAALFHDRLDTYEDLATLVLSASFFASPSGRSFNECESVDELELGFQGLILTYLEEIGLTNFLQYLLSLNVAPIYNRIFQGDAQD